MSTIYEVSYYTYTLEGKEISRGLSDFFSSKFNALERLKEAYERALAHFENVELDTEAQTPTLQYKTDNKFHVVAIEKREVH